MPQEGEAVLLLQQVRHLSPIFHLGRMLLLLYEHKLPQSAKYIVDMTATFSKEEMVAALRNTFIGNSQTLKTTTQYISLASKQTGFCMAMMEIVDDASLPIDVKQAALIQLKNTIKIRWSAKRQELEKAEKEQIRGALLTAVTRCHKNHKLIKLYKEVFTIITGHEYRQWLPVNQIIKMLAEGKEITPLLHVLLAIAASFEFSITEEERTYFFAFLKTALPALQNLLNSSQQSEYIYLCIKFLWKAVHYQINAEIKQLACAWMPLLQLVIGSSNPTYDNHAEDIQTRNTDEFYYFHSKKWATRILLRFVQKHAKRISFNKNEDNKQFSDSWYANYGSNLITTLVNQFAIGTTKKVRYFQLKCLQSLINERPDQVKQYAQAFQYDILIRFLRLQPQDEELAGRDPVQFLSREDEPSINFTNLKRVATDVWVGFTELGSKLEKKSISYEPGIFFFQNMNYIQSKLEESGNPLEKELAMYLICQLRTPISRCKQVKKILPTLIAKYVIPEFNNDIMFLRARAVDIFTEYGSMELDIEVVRKAVEGIYLCLTKDSYPLVRIKAALAFNCILKHKTAKDLVQPLLKDILTVYLQLLDSYDLENIVNSLESIVEDFAGEIGPFALELIKHLSKLFFKLFNKDAEQANNEDYDGQAELAAAGCLKTITRIIESPITPETITNIQVDILAILEFVFVEQGIDYIEDALVTLNAYLFKVPKLSGKMWFFYQVVVYNMVGIPKDMWPTLDSLPIPEKEKRIMTSIRNNENYQMMERSMPVLRNYIQKSSALPTTEPQFEGFRANIIQLLFYLVGEMYKKPPNEFSGELDITCCTALLIYLLENYQKRLPENVYAHVYEFSKINFHKYKSKMMKSLTSQLVGMLLWLAPTQVLTLAHNDHNLDNMLKEVITHQNKYELEHERARVILGINSLLLLPEKPPTIMQKMPELFKTAMVLVKKNAEERIDEEEHHGKGGSGDFEDDDDLQDYNFEDDDQDFWEEQYDDNYNSALDSIDEIAEFKNTIEALRVGQVNFYQQLLGSVQAEDLAVLDEKIKKAMEKVENSANS